MGEFIDKSKPVLITGATGYIASWIVKFFLEAGFKVNATVRDITNDEKMSFLRKMQSVYQDNLKIYEANLTDTGVFDEPVKDCSVVIHTASPFFVSDIKDPKEQLVIPALKGTENLLDSVNKTHSVKRVVLTSSVAAIYGDAADIENTDNNIFTEQYWNTTSNIKHQPYSYSKTLAEKEAKLIAKKQQRWSLVTINPGFVLGPALVRRTDSESIKLMLKLLRGEFRRGVPDLYFGFVDVRDVAQAHFNASILENACGRHILVAEAMNLLSLIDLIDKKYKQKFKLPKNKLPDLFLYIASSKLGLTKKILKRNLGIPIKFDNSYSIKNLGIKYRPLSETVNEHIEQIIQDNLV